VHQLANKKNLGFKFVALDPEFPSGAKLKKTICHMLQYRISIGSNYVSLLHSVAELPDICYEVSVVFP